MIRKLSNWKIRFQLWKRHREEIEINHWFNERKRLITRKQDIRLGKIIIKDNLAYWNSNDYKALVSLPIAIQLDKIGAPIDIKKQMNAFRNGV